MGLHTFKESLPASSRKLPHRLAQWCVSEVTLEPVKLTTLTIYHGEDGRAGHFMDVGAKRLQEGSRTRYSPSEHSPGTYYLLLSPITHQVSSTKGLIFWLGQSFHNLTVSRDSSQARPEMSLTKPSIPFLMQWGSKSRFTTALGDPREEGGRRHSEAV